ncbi:hypothetical protein TNCV_2662881 [Trichonephila clavipes]|nr:hypothetical protein TNCV_2662881 [Trichonephila clavipes]
MKAIEPAAVASSLEDSIGLRYWRVTIKGYGAKPFPTIFFAQTNKSSIFIRTLPFFIPPYELELMVSYQVDKDEAIICGRGGGKDALQQARKNLLTIERIKGLTCIAVFDALTTFQGLASANLKTTKSVRKDVA